MVFPSNGDWTGQQIIIETINAPFTIVSHDKNLITLNRDIPEGVYYCQIMGIKAQTNINARIHLFHGIHVNSQIKLRNCFISTFAGVGVAFYSNHEPYGSTKISFQPES